MSTIKYSQYDLLSEELALLEEVKNPFRRALNSLFKPKTFLFHVSVPNDLYLRAETLCDDVTNLRDEDETYTQSELVNHTFCSFIDQVRKHDSNVGGIYNRLIVRKQEILVVNNTPLFPAKSKTTVSTKIHREDVYRSEVLLRDLAVFAPKHSLQVEHLIEIVYLDFLLEYQNGRRKNVIKEIVDTLD
ncbi:hypothetical protein [Neobacillus endophyticus]|uniref:hypothetical protein n=1 Tax=Neobacillus endophyticus TaxID=2738405 RepID=UPI001C26DF2E|nr:hypothetical protein [Neobacillus endophyticus]